MLHWQRFVALLVTAASLFHVNIHTHHKFHLGLGTLDEPFRTVSTLVEAAVSPILTSNLLHLFISGQVTFGRRIAVFCATHSPHSSMSHDSRKKNYTRIGIVVVNWATARSCAHCLKRLLRTFPHGS
ncbi:hypothetical protein OG21DRAFT_1511622 [Imleria badia]|nr:hypothetical protein OG21DRAFT_1511622 [Imleria badia]